MSTRGSSLVEAIVAAGLAGAALAVLARAAAVAGVATRTMSQASSALDLAADRLETLRAFPSPDGTDHPRLPDGTAAERGWTSTGGRGTPRALTVHVLIAGRRIVLRSEAFP